MRKSKIYSQSSQQATLTSFFKINSSKQQLNSQSSSDSGYSHVKCSTAFIKSPQKIEHSSNDAGSSKCNHKSPSENVNLSSNNAGSSKCNHKSPSENVNLSSKATKGLIVRSPVKNPSKNIVDSNNKSSIARFVKSPIKIKNIRDAPPLKSISYNITPSKSKLKIIKEHDTFKTASSDITSHPVQIIDLCEDSNDATITPSPRRSPRKHPSSKPDFTSKSVAEETRHNIEFNESQLPNVSKDEPDDGFIDGIRPSIIGNYDNSRKRSAQVLDESVKLITKKRQVIPKAGCEFQSPTKGTEQFIDVDLLGCDDLSFFSDIPDLISPIDVDLSKGCRCKVLGVQQKPEGNLLLTLKCLLTDSQICCTLCFPWCNLPVKEGDLVSVKASRAASSEWEVSMDAGTWFVIHSDMLISCTTVVGSLFCPRRAILNHMFKELPTASQSSAMYVGIIVHQLLQQALKNKLTQKDQIDNLYHELIKSQDFNKMIFLQGMDLEKIKETTSMYLPKIVEFIHNYVSINGNCKGSNPKEWPGLITKIKDIEENIWVPQLGLKGKIDATVQVKINSKTKVMPLELKTGKPSNSAEHRGQVILYCMMLNLIGEESADSGLLLYLRDGSLKDVCGGDKERRHLIMLRNELASRIKMAYLSCEQDGSLSLPSPIDRMSVCKSCPQLITCTSVLRKTGENHHPLSAIVLETTSHLSDVHLDYVFLWLRLISLEANHAKHSNPIWANSIAIRENEGSCISDLSVSEEVINYGMKVEVTFTREKAISEDVFDEGEYVIISNDKQVAVATGHVRSLSPTHLTVITDRDLRKLAAPFHIDRYESSSSNSLLTSFLSILLDNTEKSRRIRTTIIDKQLPRFASKLSSRIKRVGEKVFAAINRDQVRAILQVLSADTFIIIKGMPGTGKSRTVSALIELLTLLGHSILLTSHTHSAIDNILMKLPANLHDKIIRLGHLKRVNSSISHFTEASLLASTPHLTHSQISSFYNSKTIVGVTCLGAMHPLILQREFDYCIVDEATQVCQPETIAAISAAKKFVLIGDPYQLPPLVINDKAKKLGMGISLLERLDRPAVTTSLTLQYRMNQTITDLANHITYNNQLKCADPKIASATIQLNTKHDVDMPEWLVKVCCSKLSSSVIVIDVPTPEQTSCNISKREVDIIVSVVAALKQLGIRETDMGVMSPYRAQVSLASKELSGKFSQVEVSTVDQYQGRDKSVIFYSATRNKEMVADSYDIVGDKNRLTVAITRAKHKLIIIGNVPTLSSYPNFKSLFAVINPLCFVQPRGTFD